MHLKILFFMTLLLCVASIARLREEHPRMKMVPVESDIVDLVGCLLALILLWFGIYAV